MTIKLQLQRPVDGLGQAGQIVTVSQAYARNFLLPKGLAVVATPAVLARAAQTVASAAAEQARLVALAEQARTKLSGATITLTGRANANGKLFAAVKAERILEAIQTQVGLRLPPTTALTPNHFKTTGDHAATVTLAGQTVPLTIHIDHAESD